MISPLTREHITINLIRDLAQQAHPDHSVLFLGLMLGVYRKLGETTLRQDRSSLVGKGLPILDNIVSSANSTPSYKMVASRPDGTDGTVWACRKTKMFCRKLQSMARVLKLASSSKVRP